MKRVLAILLIASCLIACNKSSTSTNSPYMGNWTGTYTGTGDNGTFAMTVDAAGHITGTVTSSSTETWTADGSVTATGAFQAVAGTATSGATFSGTMVGSSASGTWVNTASYNGTWTGSK